MSTAQEGPWNSQSIFVSRIHAHSMSVWSCSRHRKTNRKDTPNMSHKSIHKTYPCRTNRLIPRAYHNLLTFAAACASSELWIREPTARPPNIYGHSDLLTLSALSSSNSILQIAQTMTNMAGPPDVSQAVCCAYKSWKIA